MPELRTEDIDNQEIFATGRWNGDEYSETDLDAMIEAHGKVGFRPPIKLGHSDAQKLLKDAGLPAAGWVENLRREGSKLIADFKRVPRVIADLIRAGGLRKKSAEVYWEYLDEKSNTKLPRVLKAVSLLGTEIPAVTSLEDIVALYNKLADGPAHAFEDDGNEFRLYHMDCAMPVQSGMSIADFLLNYPRKSKADANYREAEGEEKCNDCKFYLGYPQACVLVEGRIEPNYVSDYYELKSGPRPQTTTGSYQVRESGGQWRVIARHSGVTLGIHDTQEQARAQMKAMLSNAESKGESYEG